MILQQSLLESLIFVQVMETLCVNSLPNAIEFPAKQGSEIHSCRFIHYLIYFLPNTKNTIENRKFRAFLCFALLVIWN